MTEVIGADVVRRKTTTVKRRMERTKMNGYFLSLKRFPMDDDDDGGGDDDVAIYCFDGSID